MLTHRAACLRPDKRSCRIVRPYRSVAEAVVEHSVPVRLWMFKKPPAPWHSAAGIGRVKTVIAAFQTCCPARVRKTTVLETTVLGFPIAKRQFLGV